MTDLILTDVTVLNPGVSRAEHQTLAIRNGKIAEIRPVAPGDPAPSCAHCTAIPGLIDAHVHTPPRVTIGNQRLFALLYLANGVTSVRDLAQSEDSVKDWATRLNTGVEVGPHVYRCGPVVDGPEPGWPSAISATTPQEARAAVRRLAADGVSCIKAYNHLDQPTFQALAASAAAAGLPLIGHVPHRVGLRRVANFEAQHLTGFPYLHKAAPWGNDIAPADLAAMTDADVEEALTLSAAHKVSLTPTISTYAARLAASDRKQFPPTPGARHLPDFWGGAWNSLVPHPVGATAIGQQAAAVARARDVAGKAHARGIDVLAGTDTLMPWAVPGESLLFEIDQLAAAFGDNEAALAAATTINGRHIDPQATGAIVVGARADLLLVPGNPVDDLTALKRWSLLVADGRPYPRRMVDGWVATYDRHFHSPLYTGVFRMISGLLEARYNSNLRIEKQGA